MLSDVGSELLVADLIAKNAGTGKDWTPFGVVEEDLYDLLPASEDIYDTLPMPPVASVLVRSR